MDAERNGGTAVCPGSYDPITMGHLDIIGRAANVFDNVVVGVVNQPVRKQKTLFSAEERCSFIAEQLTEYPHVQVKTFDTLLVDFAREHGAKAIVKGLRAISDFEYEFEMNQLNRKIDRKSTRLNSSHANISYAVFCLKKKNLYLHTRTSNQYVIHIL